MNERGLFDTTAVVTRRPTFPRATRFYSSSMIKASFHDSKSITLREEPVCS
jgi:hypothetical protein